MACCRTSIPGHGDELGSKEKAEGLQYLSNPTQPWIPRGARLSAHFHLTREDAAAAKLCLAFED